MNIKTVAKAFFNNENAKTSNESFFVENKKNITVVYSWGYHFPIAIKFNDGYLFNKDSYSQSTSRHKNIILREITTELKEEDYKTTNELKNIIQQNFKNKAEYIENAI